MGPQNKLSARVVTTKIVAQSMIDIIRMGPVLEAWKRGELNAKAHKNVSPTSSVVIRYVCAHGLVADLWTPDHENLPTKSADTSEQGVCRIPDGDH